MSKYELARDKKITISALVLEVFSVISLVLLGDSLFGENFGIISSHLPWIGPCVALIVIQYLLVGVERIARYREDPSGFTLPLVWLPFGNILRLIIMTVCIIPVVILKLIVYFISVLIQFVLLITRLNKFFGTTLLVEFIDDFTELYEKTVNSLYNFLYYNKIQTNANIFNAIFNSCLTMWCINH